jgi:hypothetical protein
MFGYGNKEVGNKELVSAAPLKSLRVECDYLANTTGLPTSAKPCSQLLYLHR